MKTQKVFSIRSLILLSVVLMGSLPAWSQQPDTPTNVSAAFDSTSINLITWVDESTISGETYNVYVSERPIADVSITGVVKVGRKIPEGQQRFLHTLYTPKDSGMVNYFYAVTAVSPSGQENRTVASGVNATSTPIENKAIATGMIAFISTPVTIDGDISEFTSRTLPFIMDSAHAWVEGGVDGDDDLSAKVYLMMDTQNFYVAADVSDEALVQNFTGFSTWNGDSFELHAGLYPLPANVSHSQRFKRGAEPDYQFRFSINEETWLHVPWPGRPNERAPNHAVSYVEIAVAPREGGYYLEGRIPFADLVADPAMQSHPGGRDSLFVPEEGMVIPIDFTLSDADIDVYQGHIYYFWQGPNIDRPFVDPTVWSQAVIGDFQTLPTGVQNDRGESTTLNDFSLTANYPNPFVRSSHSQAPPLTQTLIRYTLRTENEIALKIYNLLGHEVRTLFAGRQTAGEHETFWDGTDDFGRMVPAGVYFYRLQVGHEIKTKKLLLVN